ncbi:3-oxoacyl-ACP reductase-like protein [Neorhizobium galegae]|uniref:hypothetical protein n=1 Tax=Neorhizobium galegae TaxID=399 RepID=UPI001AE9D9EB|nr:hypothetical protein [Neorhizobium galegae]MBP2559200.1 3-oxoacyl-ACP reductase-like protein [Neorhizobium galegae]
MTTLNDSERLGEIAAIRARLKSNPQALSALNSAVSDVFSANGIEVDGSISSSLVIALPEELSENLNQVILPGGTNCS